MKKINSKTSRYIFFSMTYTIRTCYRIKLCLCMISLLIVGLHDCVLAYHPEEFINRLMYPGSFDVSIHTSNDRSNVTSVIYKVALEYPSMDVVQFYNNILKTDGWTPFVDPHNKYSDRVWQEYFDATKGDIPLVHQLIAQWRKGDQIAFLGIRYYTFGANQSERSEIRAPSSDVQNIYFQVMPFVATLPPRTVLPRPPAE